MSRLPSQRELFARFRLRSAVNTMLFRAVAPAELDEAADDEQRTQLFVASDETVDAYGDVINVEGWQLDAFKANPVALWAHDQKAPPIGSVDPIFVDSKSKRLMARINFDRGDPHVDRLWDQVKRRVIRACSVGFTISSPDDIEPIVDSQGQWTGGLRFLRAQLLELSLVNVPANPNALAVLRSFSHSLPLRSTEDAVMNELETPVGALRSITGPQRLSDCIPDDIGTQVERSGRVSFEVRRSIRELAVIARNVLGETVPTNPSIVASTSAQLVDGYLTPGPLLLSLLPRVSVTGSSITQNVIGYATPNNAGNKAAIVPEATAKPESDLVATSSVLAFAVWAHHVGVTKQALADVPALRQLVDTILTRGLLFKVDAGVFTTLTGAASVFTPGAGSSAIDNAAIAAAQLGAAGGSSVTVALNPMDIAQGDIAKASGAGAYLGRPPINATLVGVPSVPTGKLLAFASEAAYIAEREAVNVVAGIANDDFIKNIVRLLAEWRGATVVQMPSLILYGNAGAATTFREADENDENDERSTRAKRR